MLDAVRNAGPLLLGMAFIMMGNGLQGTLLGVRAEDAGFGSAVTGLVMTSYYVGFLAGAVVVPRLVRRVGHIRVFTALASVASAAVLAHFILVEPRLWAALRFLTGIAYAGLYIVAESWINDRAGNESRGELLGIYMLVSLGALTVGQLLLILGDPRDARLYIVASILLSVALVPIALSAIRAPGFDNPAPAGLRTVYRASPLGLVGCLLVGMSYGAVFGMGPVFASQEGLAPRQVAWFMAVLIAGSVVAQWPLGRLSDVIGRRTVLLAVTLLAAACCVALAALDDVAGAAGLGMAFALGAFTLPLYSICVAYTNDYLSGPQMVGASGTIVLVRGAGAIVGPAMAGVLMTLAGPDGFLWTIAGAHTLLGLFALWRMTRRSGLPVEAQHHYPAMDPGSQSLAARAALRSGREDL